MDEMDAGNQASEWTGWRCGGVSAAAGILFEVVSNGVQFFAVRGRSEHVGF